ncbi:hypothetical protein [Microbacterium sp.]|uniref:hypothetical protein n=1 Tax=Microbacterium sp. TaxID=51671 RepID=UPI003A94E21C
MHAWPSPARRGGSWPRRRTPQPPFEDAILPRLDAELERIAEAAAARGKIAGAHCADGAQAARRAAQGFTFLTAATDVSSLRADMALQLADARGARVDEVARAY